MLALAASALALWLGRDDAPRFREPRSVSELATRVTRVARASLERHRVPGAAVAIVRDGDVAWTRGFGVAPGTRFQVGSISKPVSALGILRLARARGQSLDAQLTVRGWRVPDGVTLRRLLSHTAGLSVPGYLGIPPDRAIPSLAESLAGRGGDGGPVEVVVEPGSEARYSGGGYTVAELWAQQTAGMPFATLMRDTVLRPLGMTHSDFEQRPPGPEDAAGHDAAGRPVPAYRYAARAAAGLRATAADIGRFVAAIPPAMLEPAPATGGHWSTGLELDTLDDGTTMAFHDGVNRGWFSRFVTVPAHGWGLVVLTNSDRGRAVVDDVMAELVAR